MFTALDDDEILAALAENDSEIDIDSDDDTPSPRIRVQYSSESSECESDDEDDPIRPIKTFAERQTHNLEKKNMTFVSVTVASAEPKLQRDNLLTTMHMGCRY